MGVVAAAGPGTTTAVGAPGVVFARTFCGECRWCKLGTTSQCVSLRGTVGFSLPGGYEQYILIAEHIFFPVDKDIPPAEATLLLDVMGTGSHALGRARLVHRDIRSVLVSGAGPIGLGILAMAKIILGDEVPVYITDMVPYRLELARQLKGIPINLKETSLEAELTAKGVKVDAVIDATGKEAARQAGLQVLARGGVMVCVGHGEGLQLQVVEHLINNERTVMGSDYFDFSAMDGLLVQLKEHYDYLSQIVTHRFPIEDVQRAYTLFFEQGETGKVIIEWNREVSP
jgi:threonine dehydrogenase-like Zn-dependent dehydrogenase